MKCIRLLVSSVVTCLFVAGCSNGVDSNDWPIDNGDIGADTTVDGRSDMGPVQCPNAPTARLMATPKTENVSGEPTRTKMIEVTPITDIELSSDGSLARDGHTIQRTEWRIEKRPEFALATFGFRRLRRSYERAIFLQTQERDPLLQVGLTGTYTVSLKVWNEQNVPSCNTAELQVSVRPTSELYVEFKFPYEKVESDVEGHHRYRHSEPTMVSRFKRTREAKWNESLNDVIPNTRAQRDVQDWGEQGEESDDPDWVDVSLEGATNSFVRLEGVESAVPYFGAASVYGGEVNNQTPAIFKVYIDGQQRLRDRRILGKNHDPPFGVEVVRIMKANDKFTVEPISTLWYDN